MSKKLKLAKNLLSEDWVIFISIDDNEFVQLKLLCDSIFWENYVDTYIWDLKDFTESSFTNDNFARNVVWPHFTNIARSYTAIIEALYYSLDYYFFGKSKTRLYYQKLILNNKDFL